MIKNLIIDVKKRIRDGENTPREEKNRWSENG